jgi:transaldolase
MDAFLAGLEQAKANGHDLSRLGSVASFFVARDSEIDKPARDDSPLRGQAAIANARLAYSHYEASSRATAGSPSRRRAPSRSAPLGRRPA